jgi:hypothetical protein
MLGFDQLIDQRRGGGKPDPPFLPTGGDAQARQEMGLPGATVADQHDRLGARDVAAVGELADLGRRGLRRLGEVELVEGLDARQARDLQPTRDRMVNVPV